VLLTVYTALELYMVRIYDQLTQPNKKQLQEADTVDFVDTNR